MVKRYDSIRSDGIYVAYPDYAKLEQENARIKQLAEHYEKALSFYADPENWKRICVMKSSLGQYEPSVYRVNAHTDSGAIAREALADVKEIK